MIIASVTGMAKGTRTREARWPALGMLGALCAAAVTFSSTRVSAASDARIVGTIVVREISIRRADNNQPVPAVSTTADYRVRVLVVNISDPGNGFRYTQAKTVVLAGPGGARFFADDSYSRQIPAYTSTDFELAPGKQTEFNIPARFSQPGATSDKQFVVTVTGDEVPIKSGTARINSL